MIITKLLKQELPRSVGAQYATGDQWRNNSRKNEGMEPKQKQYPAEDVTGDRSKVLCCKEQYCIGTWNVRSMNEGKLEVIKERWQEWTSTFSTKESKMQYLDAISKTTEWSLLVSKANHSITVIQVYAPTSSTEEAKGEWFYEDLQDLLELTPRKMSFSLYGTGMQK